MKRSADNLVAHIMNGEPLYPAARVDFGIDLGPELLDVYRAVLKAGEVTADQLHEAVTSQETGKALTTLLRGCPSNPKPSVLVRTVWDRLGT